MLVFLFSFLQNICSIHLRLLSHLEQWLDYITIGKHAACKHYFPSYYSCLFVYPEIFVPTRPPQRERTRNTYNFPAQNPLGTSHWLRRWSAHQSRGGRQSENLNRGIITLLCCRRKGQWGSLPCLKANWTFLFGGGSDSVDKLDGVLQILQNIRGNELSTYRLILIFLGNVFYLVLLCSFIGFSSF